MIQYRLAKAIVSLLTLREEEVSYKKSLTKRHSYIIYRLAVVFLFVFASFFASAQIVQPQRLEKEIKDNEGYYTLVSAEAQGLMLLRESQDRGEKRMRRWEFSSVDTTLETRWTKFYDIDYEFNLLGYAYNIAGISLLFRDG